MKKRVVVLAAVVALLAAVAPLAAAADAYELSGADSIDVPEQTISIEGDEFDVSSATPLESGEMIEASVTAPDDSSRYSVRLYNADKQIERSTAPRSGDGSVEFTTDQLSPGTYILGVDDGGFQAVHPIVIQGYDVSVDAPDAVTAGETVDVTVELTAREDNPPVDAVEIALIDDAVVADSTASEDGENTYSATITAPDSAGTYQLGAIVRGPDQVDGQDEQEVVAASDPMELTVQASDDGDETDSNDGSDSSGSSGSPNAPGSSDDPADDEPTATPNGTVTATPNGTATATDTPTSTDGNGTDTTGTADRNGTSDGDGPIEPASAGNASDDGSDNASDETPGERGGLGVDGPGFVPSMAILSLLGAAELIRRRN